MELAKKILKYGLLAYLIYAFIFSFLIFSFHPNADKKKETPNKVVEGTNDHVALIENAEDAISVRLHLIENAQLTIDLAYYKWVDGEVSDLMLGNILEAADRGVNVRILLDGILQLNNFKGPVDEVFLGFKSHPNIELKVFEPFNPLTPLAWNNRMHDKMILVDQQMALIGGRNIEDRFYLDDAHRDGLVKDREVFIHHSTEDTKNTASVIHEMENYYNELWHYKHAKVKHPKMTERKTKRGLAAINQLRQNHAQSKKEFLTTYFPDLQEANWTEKTVQTEGIHFVSNDLGRLNQDPKALKAITTLSSNAKESIFIQSPYFIPSRKMLGDVRIPDIPPEKTTLFTNSEAASPNVFAIAAYNNRRKYLVDSGAEIIEYQGPGSTHGKSSIFDNHLSVIGTFNIDPRSSYVNTESMVIIDSPEFAEILKEEIADDLALSLEVDTDYHYVESKHLEPADLPFFKKITIRFLSFVTPLFEKLL